MKTAINGHGFSDVSELQRDDARILKNKGNTLKVIIVINHGHKLIALCLLCEVLDWIFKGWRIKIPKERWPIRIRSNKINFIAVTFNGIQRQMRNTGEFSIKYIF